MLKKIFPFILGLIIIIFCVWYFMFYKHEKYENNLAIKHYDKVPIVSCGMTVVSPISDSNLVLPFVLTTIVDNTKRDSLGCSWTVFEAQAGTVSIVKNNGDILLDPIPLTTINENWMTVDPVLYSTKIETLKESYHGGAKIIITEEDVRGEGNTHKIEIPVVFE